MEKMTIPPQTQSRNPGLETELDPQAIHITDSYKGSGKLAGKRALVTGGDSGIGRAVALHFAREGAKVAILYLDETEDAENTRKLVEAEGTECLVVAGDIADRAVCDQAIAKIAEAWGGIDILVNNAGIQRARASLADISDEEWHWHFNVNIHGMFYLTRAALAHMGKGAAIINTTSINAFAGNKHLVAYTSTKGAIAGFTRALALQLVDQGIRVNEVAPGPFWTPIQPSGFGPYDPQIVASMTDATPMNRVGQPAELGPAYVYLAAEDSSYVTGQTIHVNGGMVVNG